MADCDKKYLRKNICVVCGKEFYSSGNNKYCSKECRDKNKDNLYHEITCKNCGKHVIVHKNAKFCSDGCRIQYKNKQATLRKQKSRNDNLIGVENVDYVKCLICGCKMHQLNESHLKYFHNITMDEYKKMYPNCVITSKKFIENNLIGDNNPASSSKTSKQERLERSPFSKEFYKKRNIDDNNRLDFIKSISKKRDYNTRLEYYTKRGYSEDDARKILYERQNTFTLEKCIETYGYVKGKERYYERQKLWSDKIEEKYKNGEFSKFPYNLSANSYSTFEIDCINEIANRIGLSPDEYYSATSDLGQYEIFDDISKKRYNYDFTYKNKIIEFNGDYWHCNPSKYDPEYYNSQLKMTAKQKWDYDKEKEDIIVKKGFKIMSIWESEFKNDKEKTIQKCIDFINE